MPVIPLTQSTPRFSALVKSVSTILTSIDTCGVTNLHGLPGLMGGIAALPIVRGLDIRQQLLGIVVTIGVAFVSGMAVGKILPLMGRKTEAYEDAEEFLDAVE